MKKQAKASIWNDLRWKMLKQLGLIGALSLLLGLTFNSANPIGVRWGPVPHAEAATEPIKVEAPQAQALQASEPAIKPIQGVDEPQPILAQSGDPAPPPPAREKVEILLPPTPPVPLVETSPDPTSAQAVPKQITWPEIKPIYEAGKVVLVDSRAAGLYRAAHIPGAVSLPLLSPPEVIRAFQQEHGPETPLVIYCGTDNCSLSQHLARKLVNEFGFTNVQYIRGGFREWQQESLLAQRSPPGSSALQAQDLRFSPNSEGAVLQPAGTPVATVQFDPNAPAPQPTSWTRVKPLLERGEIVLLDARPRSTFEAAHIPGAISLPSSAPKTVFEEFKNLHSTDTRLVIYCGSQSCSLSKRMAERLIRDYGFTSVEYMTGGFQEWQRLEVQSKTGL